MTNDQVQQMIEEHNKQIGEIWALFRKTDEQLAGMISTVNKLTGKWGKFVEYILAPGIPQAFQKKGIEIHRTAQRLKNKGMEVDILGLNQKCAVVVEVKSTLSVDDVRYFLCQLPRFKEEFPEYADRVVYGAVAGIEIEGDADKFAYRQGLFVIGQSGNTVVIRNDEKFEAKVW